METRLLHFNFDSCRSIPKALYERVWADSESQGQDFWTGGTHEELEDYLGEEVFEINRSES